MIDGMIELKDNEHFSEIINSEKKTVALFTADWCPDCIRIKMILPKLMEEFNDYTYVYIDREKHLDLVKFYDIYGIPSFLMFENGNVIKDFVSKSGKSRAEMVEFLKQ